MKFTIVLSALVGGWVTKVIATDFSHTCPNAALKDYGSGLHYITANCYQSNGVIRSTTMDMNLCMGNNNGNLVAQNNGGYFGSCSSCGFVLSDNWYSNPGFSCYCYDRGGNSRSTTIDLNTFLGNSNGHLVCPGHFGTKRSAEEEFLIEREPAGEEGNLTLVWSNPDARPPVQGTLFTA